MIQVVRSLFKYAADADQIEHPIKFGPGFKKPSAKILRRLRDANGPRMFEAADLRKLIDSADVTTKAMVTLAANGALGNTDLALLPTKALDLEAAWLVYPRSKTAVNRRIPLWPETVKALKAYLKVRPVPKDPADAGLLFISPRGLNFVGKFKGYRVTAAFDRLAKFAGVEGRQFYDLRRTFQTMGEGVRDLSAVQAIMGHAAASNDTRQKILTWITTGELRAINLANRTGGGPRYRIAASALADFLNRRAASAEPTPPKPPRNRRRAEVKSFV